MNSKESKEREESEKREMRIFIRKKVEVCYKFCFQGCRK